MAKKPKNPHASPLEKHPKIVRAIGMVSIENASMESMLGELLGALLGIHLEIGHTIYFTPSGLLACTRFRGHRVRCFDGTGGVSWSDGSLHGSSSLRLCG
jgi:hypothetical protein